ncbi:unnamed protein product [Effrenium voratum]|nr:unnamed protein product [Effrenium voratum]
MGFPQHGDHYRLDIDTRRSVARTIFFQSLDRWKESNNKFAHERKRLNGLWQQWRLQVQALGPMQKEHWPPPPPHLDPPSEVYDVDTKKMKILIITGLAQSALGRSLFARDMRRVSAS